MYVLVTCVYPCQFMKILVNFSMNTYLLITITKGTCRGIFELNRHNSIRNVNTKYNYDVITDIEILHQTEYFVFLIYYSIFLFR